MFLCKNIKNTVKTRLFLHNTQTDRYLKYFLKNVPGFFTPSIMVLGIKKTGLNCCDFCLKWLDMPILCTNFH